MHKLSIIVPVYNEKETVLTVLSQIQNLRLKNVQKEVVVIDDGSTDGTCRLLENNQRRLKYMLCKNRQNRGKGYSVRLGLKKCTGDIILIQDADLEYKVSEYPELLRPIINGETRFVMGSRHLNTRPHKTHQFLESKLYARVLNIGAVFYSRLVAFLLQANLTDPGTMYKVFTKDCLDGLTLKSNHFDIDWEIVNKFIRKGIYPIEIPVTYKSRSPQEGKKIKLFRDGSLILWAILRYRFID